MNWLTEVIGTPTVPEGFHLFQALVHSIQIAEIFIQIQMSSQLIKLLTFFSYTCGLPLFNFS